MTTESTITRTTNPLDASADGNIKAIKLYGNSYKDGEEIIIPSGVIESRTKNLAIRTSRIYLVNGTRKVLSDGECETVIFKVKKGHTYVASSVVTHDRSVVAYVNNDDPKNGDATRTTSATVGQTFTATEDGIVAWYLLSRADSTFEQTIQVEEGTTPSEYVPHETSTIHTDRPLLSVNDIRNELIIDKDGNGTFTERVILQNDELVVKDTPTTEALTQAEISNILSLKTFDGNTYIDTDGCPFEITYVTNQTIGTLYDKTEDLQKQIDDIKPYENIYAEEETVVGTWIDGKTLYRRVYPYNQPLSTTTKTTNYKNRNRRVKRC